MKKSNREAKLFLKEEGKKSSCGGIRSGGSQSHNLPYSGRVEGQKRLNMESQSEKKSGTHYKKEESKADEGEA